MVGGALGSPHDSPAVPWPACRSCTAIPHAAPTGRPSGCACDGGRIVDADAPGIDADLRGLTLLEACAVGGETLPVDALANALAPAVRAAPDAGRVAVAMSGGVDSAVTLLKAGPAAVGVTLRLWLDPNGPDAERACCSPSAVLAARESCHARGLPHVTLDLRDAFRRAVVTPFVRGLRAW